jgi:NADPH-dependent F420 reductase
MQVLFPNCRRHADAPRNAGAYRRRAHTLPSSDNVQSHADSGYIHSDATNAPEASHDHKETPMKIAIIGAGKVGRALATSAIRTGHSVTVSSASADTAAKLAEETGARAAASNRAAVEGADLVVLAVPYTSMVDVLDDVGPSLAGKIVVDATNPLKPDYSGLAVEGTSGAEEIQARVPQARVVKAFNTQFAARQVDPQVAGIHVDGYVASDDEEAKQIVLGLVREMGFHPIDAGQLTMARALEAMAFLNISLQLRHNWSWQAGWKLVGPEGDAS